MYNDLLGHRAHRQSWRRRRTKNVCFALVEIFLEETA